MFDYDADREREDALENENAPMSMHVSEYVRNHGALQRGDAWILSPFDTWEANPFFVGPRPPHPESSSEEQDAWYDAHPVTPAPKSDDDLWAEACDARDRTPFF